MKDMFLIVFWIIAVANCVWNACGFATGDTYDYHYQRKTYCGTKLLIWGGVLVVMYYIPWQSLGFLTL